MADGERKRPSEKGKRTLCILEGIFENSLGCFCCWENQCCLWATKWGCKEVEGHERYPLRLERVLKQSTLKELRNSTTREGGQNRATRQGNGDKSRKALNT